MVSRARHALYLGSALHGLEREEPGPFELVTVDLDLELVLVDLGAYAARGGADAQHKGLVGPLLALTQLAPGGRSPSLAAGVVVLAYDAAHAAGLGALLHHGQGVTLALAAVVPDGALGLVLVDALTHLAHATRRGTLV